MKIAFVYNKKESDSIEEAEFDTQETIDAISNALSFDGNEIIQVPMTRDESWISQLRKISPELIFNTAEGYQGIGRESYGPIVFEQLGIPYVGPGPYVCFLTLDKFLTKQMVAYQKVPVVEGVFITRSKELETTAKDIEFPVFVKPNYEGSSKGISKRSLCRTYNDLINFGKESLKQFPDGILVEKFIHGRDISIAFLASVGKDGVLDPIEYQISDKITDEWVYDYEYKNYFDEKVKAICPADLGDNLLTEIKIHMRNCVDALGIVDFGRADFRVTPDGELFFMEFNALPSLQPGAGIFEATRHLGLNYSDTIKTIINTSIDRMKIKGKRLRPSHKTSIKNPKIALVYNLGQKESGEEVSANEVGFDSQSSIASILKSVKDLGHDAITIEANRDLAAQLNQNNVNIVFNIAEGITSHARESQIPAICDLMCIEYTGSDANCLSVALDKAVSKKVVSSEGILTPNSKLFSGPVKKLPKNFDLQYPIIVKPNYEGTSKGITENSVVHNPNELFEAINILWQQIPGPILVEEYILGREFTLGVFGNSTLKTLGPLEIQFRKGKYPVYTFAAKLDKSLDNDASLALICPVDDLAPAIQKTLILSAKKAFRALHCRDVGRVDFRIDQKGRVYFLELNPLPGITPQFSDFAIMAEKSGLQYSQLIRAILNPAIQRWRAAKKKQSP